MGNGNKTKKYDLIFSLGEACFCSLALRGINIQQASFPFDWIAGCSFTERCNILMNNFDRFFEKDDLEYIDVAPQGKSNAYYNKYNTLTFNHDFPINLSFDDAYKLSKEKYDRRIKRLYKNINDAKSVLIVYMELPSTNHKEFSDEILLESFNSLRNHFGEKINVLYLKNSSTEKSTQDIANGFTKMIFNYKNYQKADDDYAPDMQIIKSTISNYKLSNTTIFSELKRQCFIRTIKLMPSKSLREKLRKKYHIY